MRFTVGVEHIKNIFVGFLQPSDEVDVPWNEFELMKSFKVKFIYEIFVIFYWFLLKSLTYSLSSKEYLKTLQNLFKNYFLFVHPLNKVKAYLNTLRKHVVCV